MRERFVWVPLILLIGGVVSGFLILRESQTEIPIPFRPSIIIPTITCPIDKDGDGLDDLKDIVAGAKAEVQRKPKYLSVYYQKGYPPESEGVCTDVVWRAFRDAGYDLKGLVDQDIKANVAQYSRLQGKPDPNIDFRRVPNLIVFFQRKAQVLTREIIPGNVENLTLWQPGDIVTYGHPHEHIAIVSDKRTADGVPYILHNAGPIPTESNQLNSWPSPMTGHWRFPRF